jgi:hypothetical protein
MVVLYPDSAFRPWILKGRAWMLPYWAPNGKLPTDAYPVQDRGTPYSDESVNGTFAGGMGAIQIVRYAETEVGE